MFEQLSAGGQILYLLAHAFGARVTSGKRTPEENKAVGGLENSKHLTGDAIDIGREAPAIAVSVLGVFGKVIYDTEGTAPHIHIEATELTLPLFLGLVLIGGRVLR